MGAGGAGRLTIESAAKTAALGARNVSAPRVTIAVHEHSPWQAPADFDAAVAHEPSRVSGGEAQQHLAASELHTLPSQAHERLTRPNAPARTASIIQAARTCRTSGTCFRIDATRR